jgi:hypothetical protein
MPAQALIHTLLANPLSGEDIERKSFNIIDQRLPESASMGKGWLVVRRLVHTSGDVGLANALQISHKCELPDVREVALPSRETFPVPPGRDELVVSAPKVEVADHLGRAPERGERADR